MRLNVTKEFLLISAFVLVPHFANAAEEVVKIYPHPSDAGVRVSPYPGMWSTQFSSTYGEDQQAEQYRALAYTAAFNSSSGYVAIYRSFMSFDTSGIPENAVIISAKLHVHPDYVLNAFDDEYAYMNVLQGFQASPTEVTYDDIELCGDTLVNPTKGASDINLSSITVGEYLAFELNAIGRSWIDAQGYTKLCLREGHDIENVEPFHDGNFWKESGITHYTSEAPGTSTDPYLEITYTVPDDEPTLSELIDTFRTTVLSYELPKKVERAYLTQLRLLERSIEGERYKAASAQVLVLKLSLAADKKHRHLSNAEYQELLSLLGDISDALKELR